ncbi:MAG: hypothetical protein GWP15_02245 [Nitrospirae bacterium]|nr:hypothetical protein [Nitrospirota bacterium]
MGTPEDLPPLTRGHLIASLTAAAVLATCFVICGNDPKYRMVEVLNGKTRIALAKCAVLDTTDDKVCKEGLKLISEELKDK